MKKLEKSFRNLKTVSEEILKGNLICSPTDTLYGLLGSALLENVYKAIYRLKKRNPKKPLIVLFNSLERAESLGVVIPKKLKVPLKRLFPERLTVILPLKENSPLYKIVKRKDIAFRIPKDEFLIELIKNSHPLFAPSANVEGEKPAENCKECEAYFNGEISLCLEGEVFKKPSTIVSLVDGVKLIREGALPFRKVLEVLSG